MGRHEMHAVREVGRHLPQYRAFDRADIGDNCARVEMRSDLPRDGAAGADRDADDDKIGAFDGRRIGLDHLIGDCRARRSAGGLPAVRAVATIARAAPCSARRSGDRGADQPGPDQRQAVEQRLRAHLPDVQNSASASTTSRFASSVPTVMRSAFDNP